MCSLISSLNTSFVFRAVSLQQRQPQSTQELRLDGTGGGGGGGDGDRDVKWKVSQTKYDTSETFSYLLLNISTQSTIPVLQTKSVKMYLFLYRYQCNGYYYHNVQYNDSMIQWMCTSDQWIFKGIRTGKTSFQINSFYMWQFSRIQKQICALSHGSSFQISTSGNTYNY